MKKKRIYFYCDEKLENDLKDISTNQGKSISFIIRTLLRNDLNYYKNKPSNESKNV